MPDISAYVQKTTVRHRLEQPFRDPATESWAHPAHSERNHTDECASVIKIELVRHALLQMRWIGFVMDEKCALPICKKSGSPRTDNKRRLAASLVSLAAAWVFTYFSKKRPRSKPSPSLRNRKTGENGLRCAYDRRANELGCSATTASKSG